MRLISLRRIAALALGLSLTAGLTAGTTPANAGGSLCPKTESDLAAAISSAGSGGTVVLSCPSSQDVPFTSVVTIGQSVTLDAGSSPGTITLDGQNATGLFNVTAGPFTIKSLTLSNAAPGAILGSGSLIVKDSVLSHNQIGIQASGDLDVTGTTFAGNWTDRECAAAICGQGPMLTVTDSTFVDNTASANNDPPNSSYGAIDTSSKLTITGSTFVNNSPGAVGAFSSDPMSISNSTFSGNWGGVMTVALGTLTITDSTISGNTGVFLSALTSLAPGTIALGGDIISGNPGGNCTPYSQEFNGMISDDGYNVSDDSSCGFTNGVKGDIVGALGSIVLGAPADNGGPTETMAIQPKSPAVDAIPATSGLCPSTDQRGFSRATAGGSDCDAGSYEYQDPQTVTFNGPTQTKVGYGASPVVSGTGGGSGSPVVFSVDPGSSTVCSVGTSSGNHATVTTSGLGACTVEANQAGGDGYAAAQPAVENVLIDKSGVVLAYAGPHSLRVGKPAQLSARLTSLQGAPLTGQTVSFTLFPYQLDKQTCTGVIESTGEVTCRVASVRDFQGRRFVSVAFLGDATYRSQSKMAIISVAR